MIYVCVCICPVAFHNISRLSKVFKFCIERWIESYNLHFLCSPMENNFHFSTTNINHSSHQILPFTTERKFVNIPNLGITQGVLNERVTHTPRTETKELAVILKKCTLPELSRMKTSWMLKI